MSLFTETAVQEAERCMTEAEQRFRSRNFVGARAILKRALRTDLRKKIELLSADEEPFRAHRAYTDVMRRGFLLLLRLGDETQAQEVYRRAKAWADNPQCSSIKQFEQIEQDWAMRKSFLREGKTTRGWVGALFSAFTF